MAGATVLLYNFTPQEVGTFRLLLRMLPGVLVHSVPKNAFGMTIGAVLDGKTPPKLHLGRDFSRKMLVMTPVGGAMVEVLLKACGQATPEKVLRAMVTDTNRDWTATALYDELLSEETALGG